MHDVWPREAPACKPSSPATSRFRSSLYGVWKCVCVCGGVGNLFQVFWQLLTFWPSWAILRVSWCQVHHGNGSVSHSYPTMHCSGLQVMLDIFSWWHSGLLLCHNSDFGLQIKGAIFRCVPGEGMMTYFLLFFKRGLGEK